MAQRILTFEPYASVANPTSASLMEIATNLAAELKTFFNLDYDLDIYNPPTSNSGKNVYIIGLPDIDGNKTRYGVYLSTSASNATTVTDITVGNFKYAMCGITINNTLAATTATRTICSRPGGGIITVSYSSSSTFSFTQGRTFVFYDNPNTFMQSRGFSTIFANSSTDLENALAQTAVSCCNTIIKCKSIATGETDHLYLYYPDNTNSAVAMLSPNGSDGFSASSVNIYNEAFLSLSPLFVSGYTTENIYVDRLTNTAVNAYFARNTAPNDSWFYDGITINGIHYKGSFTYQNFGARLFMPDNS